MLVLFEPDCTDHCAAIVSSDLTRCGPTVAAKESTINAQEWERLVHVEFNALFEVFFAWARSSCAPLYSVVPSNVSRAGRTERSTNCEPIDFSRFAIA